jgi:DNA repair protein RadC
MTALGPRDRPREKLERHDAAALGDNELLALIIGHGRPGVNALSVANAVLEAAAGVHGLTRISRQALQQVPGVGGALACRIQAAVELGRRTLTLEPPERLSLVEPRELALFLLPQYGAYPLERFGVVMLDSRHRLLRAQIISIGSLDAVMVNPREVFREATIAGAAAIAAFHNHPSGDPSPTLEDIDMTVRLRRAGEIMGIELVDHIVLADSRYVSMKERRIFPWAR